MGTLTPRKRSAPPPKARGPAPASRAPAGDLVERIALFTAAFAPDRAAGLLGQLVPKARDEALRCAERISALDPASRHGRVARMFGERSEAAQRLRRLLVFAPASLARALWVRMPVHHQTSFPELAQPPVRGSVPPPRVAVFAARLVKEALY